MLVDTAILYVVHYTNHGQPGVRWPLPCRRTYAMSDCALTRPKDLSHRLIDDNHTGRAGSVALIKGPAFNEANAHSLKIASPHKLPVIDVLERATRLGNEP